MNVLVVADGYPDPNGFGFSLGPKDLTDARFTLETFLMTLRRSGMTVHTANRGWDDPHATIKGIFDFVGSLPSLFDYDVLCLFGYMGTNYRERNDSLAFIGDHELAAISSFMDAGGGVLATGDHDGLGSLLCGKIPRVRSMRKWFSPSDTDPYVVTSVPWSERNCPGGSELRADTTRADRNGHWHFDNQSDDIPQPLSFPGGVIHPIFHLGNNFALAAFPDHMHEGEVTTPWSLTDSFSFAGQPSSPEYPVNGSYQEVPKIIATGSIIGGHATPIDDGMPCENENFVGSYENTIARSINLVCAYDGHTVGVGRVLTDSSFHHYLDLNLTGDPCSNTMTPKQKGFRTPAGRTMLEGMTRFYVNAVKWLARWETVSVPDLTGWGEAQYNQILAQQFLKVGEVKQLPPESSDSPMTPPLVVDQTPSPGTIVKIRSAVDLVVQKKVLPLV